MIASDDLLSRILAQCVRHEVVYFALRRILAFNGCEIYLQPVPIALVGRTFNEGHSAVQDAVLLGVRDKAGVLTLSPSADDPLVFAASDRLVLLAPAQVPKRLGDTLPVPMTGLACSLPPEPQPQTV